MTRLELLFTVTEKTGEGAGLGRKCIWFGVNVTRQTD